MTKGRRKEESNPLATTDFELRRSFDAHSYNYRARVTDRNRNKRLSVVDEIIRGFLGRETESNYFSSILDAGCGTGHRLEYLIRGGSWRQNPWSEVVGVDYSVPMLAQAKKRSIAGSSLYSLLVASDLSTLSLLGNFPLALSLWGILNGNFHQRMRILAALTGCLAPGGVLVIDLVTEREFPNKIAAEQSINQILPASKRSSQEGKRQIWYQRPDSTLGYLHLFNKEDINQMLQETGIRIIECWGYSYEGLEPEALEVDDDGCLRSNAVEHSAVVLFLQKPLTG